MNEVMYAHVHVFPNMLDFLGGPYLIIERNANTILKVQLHQTGTFYPQVREISDASVLKIIKCLYTPIITV